MGIEIVPGRPTHDGTAARCPTSEIVPSLLGYPSGNGISQDRGLWRGTLRNPSVVAVAERAAIVTAALMYMLPILSIS